MGTGFFPGYSVNLNERGGDPMSETSFPRRVAEELERARKMHGDIHSIHEGIAVVREEYLEVEREVFRNPPPLPAIYLELVHLAAMCQRMAEDALSAYDSMTDERLEEVQHRYG